MMMVFGHRGYSARYPENSILAFKKAFEAGADGVELDVRYTKDKKLVVFHDPDLKRMFNEDVSLKDEDFEDLENHTFSGQRVPTLEEVLNLVPRDKWVIVELKEREPAREAIELVERKGMRDRTIFSSFDHELIGNMKRERSDLKLALLIGEEHEGIPPEELLKGILRIRPHSVHIPKDAYLKYPELVKEFMKMLKDNGIQVFMWNINDVETYRELSDLVDAVITDEVELFISEKKNRPERVS